MLPGLEVVSVYVSCYIFLSVVSGKLATSDSTSDCLINESCDSTVDSTSDCLINESCDSTVDSTSDCLIYYLSSYARCDHTTQRIV